MEIENLEFILELRGWIICYGYYTIYKCGEQFYEVLHIL